MKDWKDYIQFFKDFFNTLAGKLTAILAFALLVIIALGWFGTSIPADYKWLVYIVVVGAMLIFSMQAIMQVAQKRREGQPEGQAHEPKPGTPKPATPAEKDEEKKMPVTDTFDARECYLRAIVWDCEKVRLAGLDPNASDPKRGGMRLEKLYVTLDTTTPKEKPEEKGQKASTALPRPDKESEPLSVLEAWLSSEKQRMVLLGLPGTGKSTFVRYLALSMANADLFRTELPKGWQGRPLLPFILSLGRFAETLPADCRKGYAALLENYLVETLKADKNSCEFAPLALRTLEREGALVMFDGLDEVAALEKRPLVVQAVEDFVLKYSQKNPASYFLVTCRTYSYRNDAEWKLTGWPVHEVALLDRPKIEYFINAWYAEMGQLEPARKPEFARKGESLLKYTQPGERRQLSVIASTPIILTIMAVVHTHGSELPNTRAQVYEQCVNLLLIHWQYRRPIQGVETQSSILEALDVPESVLLQALWEVAYHAHEGRKEKDGQAALVTEELLRGYLDVYLKDSAKVDIFMKYCESTNGLLMLQGSLAVPGRPSRKLYAFPHLTFEEYLAARYLAGEDADELAYPLAGKTDRWREAIKLLGEHLCFGSPQAPTMASWLDALSNPPAEASDEEKARMAWLAGEMLVLFRRAFPNKTAHADEDIFAQLKQQAVASLPDPRIRANCADLADELGCQPGDLYSFVKIPGQDKILPYWMAKYPVTNAQYNRFLTPENFNVGRDSIPPACWLDFPKFGEFDEKNPEKSCRATGKWKEEGWKWLREQENEFENGVLLPRYWRDARFGISRPNAPVVGISWYEANAYCKWLATQADSPELQGLAAVEGLMSKVIFRLPTENEWVLAAGGAENNRFAWDKDKATEKEAEIYQRANVHGQINRTTSVWMYIQGASEPHQIMDMSGNVWEWQANLYGEGGFSKESPGLRGGSWGFHLDSARVSLRLDYRPGNGLNDVGFRLAALPSDALVS